MKNDTVKWQLSVNQANYIFNLLAQRPFAEVNELIQQLAAQSNVQPEAPTPIDDAPAADAA